MKLSCNTISTAALAACVLILLVAPVSSNIITFGTLYPPMVSPGGTYNDRFALTLPGEYYGLAYYGGDSGYAATQFYTIHLAINGVFYFDTITASTGLVVDRFDCSTTAATPDMDSLTFAAPNMGYGPIMYYYLRTDHTNNDTSVFGYIIPGGVVGVVVDLPIANMTKGFDAVTFAGADVGLGANHFYYLRHEEDTCRSYFGIINLATLTRADIMPLDYNFDALYFSELDIGYGVNKFYFLRHDSLNTSTFGSIDPVAKTFTDHYVLGKNFNELAFTATNTAFGANLFYTMRGADFDTCVPTKGSELYPGGGEGIVSESEGNTLLSGILSLFVITVAIIIL